MHSGECSGSNRVTPKGGKGIVNEEMRKWETDTLDYKSVLQCTVEWHLLQSGSEY